MRPFRSASDRPPGGRALSASLFSPTSKLLLSRGPSLERSGRYLVFSVVSTSDFSWLVLSPSSRCICALERSSTSFRPCGPCVLRLHPSISRESSLRRCLRWLFSFKPSLSWSWRCRALSGEAFKMLFASVTWNWWESARSPRDRICPWRRAIISP